MAVTIKDVARETNLALSTISKYINGGKVREKNRKAIEEAVERLGYYPNDLARGLRTAKSYTVGFLFAAMCDEFSLEIMRSAEKMLRKNGYLTILCSHRDNDENAEEAVRFLIEKGVDGIILAPLPTKRDYIHPIVEAKIPLAIVDHKIPGYQMDYVLTDNTNGAYEAVEELINKGHRDIAMLSGPSNMYTSVEREKGYYRALEDYDITLNEDFVLKGDYTLEGGYDGIQKLWSLEHKPTAIFISNYYMCLGAFKAIHDIEIDVPEQLSVITFDDLVFSKVNSPQISSMAQPNEEIGEQVVEIILKRINGEYDDFPKLVRIKAKYMERESVRQCSERRDGSL